MSTQSPSQIGRILTRIRAAWSEMDHAQRRLFEIRTGIPADRPRLRG